MKRLSATSYMLLLAALILLPIGCYSSEAAEVDDYISSSYGGYTSILEAPPYGPAPWSPLVLPGFPDPPVNVKLPVLMYHHVGEPAADASDMTRRLTVSGAQFEQQMGYLSQAGYETVSQEQLFNALYYGAPLPARPVMLTLDDGFTDAYEVAAPILEKYGHQATFFIIAEKVGVLGHMDWPQVLDLEDRGMDIGAHTMSHADLRIQDAAGLDRELTQSAQIIGDQLGHPVYWLCYPSGSFNDTTMLHAWASGYYFGYTTYPGEMHSSDLPLMLNRWRIGPGTGMEEFIRLVD